MKMNAIMNTPSFKGYESTFCMIKPDAVENKNVGDIISIVEKECPDLEIDKLELTTLSKKTAKKHYAEHKGKGFYNELIEFITSGPVVKMKISGENAIEKVRSIAKPIRDLYATDMTKNAVHTSDTEAGSAKRELKIHRFNRAA